MENVITQERIKLISKVRPIVSHLLYADNVMIFLEANFYNATEIEHVFDELAQTTRFQITNSSLNCTLKNMRKIAHKFYGFLA